MWRDELVGRSTSRKRAQSSRAHRRGLNEDPESCSTHRGLLAQRFKSGVAPPPGARPGRAKALSQARLQLVDEVLVLKQDAIAWLELLVVAQLLDVVRLLAHQFDRV